MPHCTGNYSIFERRFLAFKNRFPVIILSLRPAQTPVYCFENLRQAHFPSCVSLGCKPDLYIPHPFILIVHCKFVGYPIKVLILLHDRTAVPENLQVLLKAPIILFEGVPPQSGYGV